MKKIIALASLTLLFLTSQAHAKLRTWSIYESENFSVYTDLTEKGAKSLLNEFETFRTSIFTVLNLPASPENSKLDIVVYSRPTEYKKIRPSDNVVGFFMPTDAGPRMVIGPSRGMKASQVLYHEYIHQIMQEHVTFPVPRWYNEGFAEFLSTTEIKGTKASIGKPDEGRTDNLGFLGKLPLEQLLKPDFSKESDIFMARYYATAWLFMHYLQVSPIDTGSDLQQQTAQFIYRITKGEDPVEALLPSYGKTLKEMNRDLLSYQRKNKFTYIYFNVTPYDKEITKKKLTHNERAYVLGDMATRMGKDELAFEYLSDLKESEKDAARSLSLLAVLENHRDSIEAASQARDKAFKLDSKDSQVLSNIAHHDWDSYDRTKESGVPDDSYLQQTLEHTQSAIEQDPQNLEAYFFQWQAQIETNQHTPALKSMMAAYQLQPASISINATIGEFLFQVDKPKLARTFIERVYNWSHNEEQLKEAKKLLDQIDESTESTTTN